jgi:hypothetical protein
MNKEHIQQITRGFRTEFEKGIDEAAERGTIKESFHYKGRPVTELESNFVPINYHLKPGDLDLPKLTFELKERQSDFEPLNIPSDSEREYLLGYKLGMDDKRAEIVAMVMNMTRENPNVSGLEILKKL